MQAHPWHSVATRDQASTSSLRVGLVDVERSAVDAGLSARQGFRVTWALISSPADLRQRARTLERLVVRGGG